MFCKMQVSLTERWFLSGILAFCYGCNYNVFVKWEQSLKRNIGSEEKRAETAGVQYEQWMDFSDERNLPCASQQTIETDRFMEYNGEEW